MRANKEKGLKARISEFKQVKSYMTETDLTPGTAGNLKRMVRDFKKTGVYPPAWGMVLFGFEICLLSSEDQYRRQQVILFYANWLFERGRE
mmetsp:Transcript_34644/g.69999  ORF Transcript_34644/g.69999 Transcript_34644/m.69999 type:complete len:91 (-) Transcript_34644:372-644(-)